MLTSWKQHDSLPFYVTPLEAFMIWASNLKRFLLFCVFFYLFLLVILIISISGPFKWFNFLFYRTSPVNVLSKYAWHMVNFDSVFWRNTKVLDCVISRRTYKLLTLPFDGRQCSDFLNFFEYVPWKPIIIALNYSILQCLIKIRNLVKFKNEHSVVQGHFHSLH